MAKDWEYEISRTRTAIIERMAQYGENSATFPFTMYLEMREEGAIWCVDIHVRVKRQTEFEVSSEGPTLGNALKRAWICLSNEPMRLRQAKAANDQFGITP